MLETCDLESNGKLRRRNVSQTHKYRKRIGEKRVAAKRKKVDPENRTSSNNSETCLNDYNQTPKELGQRVHCVLNKQIRSGVIRYLGATHFSGGQWCGIVLDEPFGKNDGSVKGVRYFTCAENYGIFVHVHKVRIADKPDSAKDGFEFKESEELLAHRNSPRNFKQDHPSSNDNTGSCAMKQRSKSLSDRTNIKPTSSDSSKYVSKTDTSCRERSLRSRSLTEILDLNELCKKCEEKCKDYREIDTRCKCYDLKSESSIIARNNMNSSNVVVEQCLKEAVETSICREFMTTSSNLMDDVARDNDKRLYSSDYITGSALKTECDSNSPGRHAALERNTTIDAFVQGKYCSYPNLVPSQHLSSSLAACIDLGRQQIVESISSEKVSPKDETLSGFNSIVETEHESTSDHSEPDYNSNKLPHNGRSKSLPLVLVPVRSISETESLFWSTDKLPSFSLIKEERSVSWPVLSTSACRLDLRHDNKIDEAYNNVTTDQQHKIIKDTPFLDTKESISNQDKHESTKILTLKRPSGVDSIVLSDSESLSYSQSQLSLPSVETTSSMKGQKVRASSTSCAKSQTRAKSQRNPKVMPKTIDKTRNKKSIDINPSPFKVLKRHTVTGIQKYQTTNLTCISKPSMTRRSASTLSSASTTVSPTGGKSKLPTMKKLPQYTTEKPQQSKPSIKPTAIRPASIALQDVKKLPMAYTNQSKEVKSVAKTSAKRKPPMLSSHRTSTKTGSFVKKRLQTTRKPEQLAVSAAEKSSTNATLLNKDKSTKSISLQSTARRPEIKLASSPSKHYHSRLPTRKITSRDGIVESTHSHECDIDTASVETEESDYIDSRRLSRVEGYTIDNCDADRSDLESSTKSWQDVSHAPDLLKGTRVINRRSIEVQVELNEENEENIRVKYFALERMLHAIKNDYHDLELAVDKRDTHLFSSAILIAALCKKLQGNGRLIVHLKQELHMTESDLKHVQERLAEEEANAVKLQEEMMYARSEHTVAIQNLKADHENTLEGLRYSLNKHYAEEISMANDRHAEELAEINKVHAEKVLEIRKRQEKTVAAVTEKYKDEIVELESRHSQQTDELLEEHQVEIETIKTDYEEQHAVLETKLIAATKECASLNMQLQQLKEDTERDIQAKIQVEIENCKALPAELESMKAVLDMRNEENKQLKKERMEAQMEVDHLRKVADRVKKLEHENESLSFVVQNKSKYERQLSVEHEHLKSTLDRESKKLKRLSLENEELQWKLYQSSPSEENSTFEFAADKSPPTSKRQSFRLSATSPDVGTIDE